MPTGRVCLLILDSFGIGASVDAADYNDSGSNTFFHIADACAQGLADKAGLRQGPLLLPNLQRYGLYHAASLSSGSSSIDLAQLSDPVGLYGYAVEQSVGKDTPSGHWELAGVPVIVPWGYFPVKSQCFPAELVENLQLIGNIPGILGEKHASGTDILIEFGELHMQTHMPIVYTSADSVLQIAAHEETFGLDRLYALCEVARKLVDPYNIGRVIARPFAGVPGNFKRTAGRRDYSMPPPQRTLLDKLKDAGREVIAIGKIADIFAHNGITETILPYGNMHLFDTTLSSLKTAPDGSLIFTNFVDFDSLYGHRRDLIGYAHALEELDARLPELEAALQPNDCMIIAADHGCDPTFPGTDHTREHIPILAYGKKLRGGCIGGRDTFADVGQSIATHLQIEPLSYGTSFL